jgi:hypothetical protein
VAETIGGGNHEEATDAVRESTRRGGGCGDSLCGSDFVAVGWIWKKVGNFSAGVWFRRYGQTGQGFRYGQSFLLQYEIAEQSRMGTQESNLGEDENSPRGD